MKVRIRGAKLELLQETPKARRAKASVAVTDGNDESGSERAKLNVKPKKPR